MAVDQKSNLTRRTRRLCSSNTIMWMRLRQEASSKDVL